MLPQAEEKYLERAKQVGIMFMDRYSLRLEHRIYQCPGIFINIYSRIFRLHTSEFSLLAGIQSGTAKNSSETSVSQRDNVTR
jgi:hypothetical protein